MSTSADLDGLVEAAWNARDEASFNALFKALRGRELYFNIAVDALGRQTIPRVWVQPEYTAVVFYTSKTNPELAESFSGLPWEKALAMLVNMPGVEGLVVRSQGDAWIAVDQAHAQAMLATG